MTSTMNKIVNPFIYSEIDRLGISKPDIAPFNSETYAQAYEDIFVRYLLGALFRTHAESCRNLVMVEIGANHSVSTSSTYLLKKTLGIPSILFEANPELIPELERTRVGDIVINAAISDSTERTATFFIAKDNEISSLDARFLLEWRRPGIKEKIAVPNLHINQVLASACKDRAVLLFIDTEGMDLKILLSMDFGKYRPLVIQCEPSEAFSPGATNSIIELMVGNDYLLIGESAHNLIFIDAKTLFKKRD
jgi:FkbM family methyltransferase